MTSTKRVQPELDLSLPSDPDFSSSSSNANGSETITHSSQMLESNGDKLMRKLKEQPLVPVGSLLTCVALIAASNHLRKGNRTEFNRALRWRVGFQGITVVAAVGGSLYYGRAATNPDGPPAASSSGYGRPTTILQQSRTEARNVAEKAGLQERMAQAAEADQLESDAVERVAAQTQPKERPVIGQDRRI